MHSCKSIKSKLVKIYLTGMILKIIFVCLRYTIYWTFSEYITLSYKVIFKLTFNISTEFIWYAKDFLFDICNFILKWIKRIC